MNFGPTAKPGTQHLAAVAALVVAMTLWLVPAAADSPTMVFREIGVDRGLEGRAITDVLVDRDGFVWATSREGLYRYDGYQAERFLPDANDPFAISDSDLRALFQSADGSLWVSANTGGLNRLDPETGRFEVFRHDEQDPASLSYDSVYTVIEDRSGGIWAATQFGLNRLDRASGQFTVFRHDPADPGSLAHDYVYDLALADDGSVWAATIGGGLSRWRETTGGLERIDLARATGDTRHNDAFAVLQGKDGQIWVGTRGGLLRVDPDSAAVEVAAEADDGLGITSLAEGPAGDIWMGTLSRGVLVFEPQSGRLHAVNAASLGSAGQLPAVPQLRITFLGERLLVGTWGGGLFLGDRSEARFRLIEASDRGLQYHDVTSLNFDTERQHLWVGSFGGGLQAYDPRRQKFIDAPRQQQPFIESGIMAIAELGDGRLFAGDTIGLWELDWPGQAQLHRAESGKRGRIGAGYVTSLLAADGWLWIGTGGSGLYRLDDSTGTFVKFSTNRAPPEADDKAGKGPRDFVTALLAPAGGRLWVGTRSGGLVLCSIQPWSCPQHLTGSGPAPRLAHDNVTALLQDSRGRMWIGTDGGGLHLATVDSAGLITGLRYWNEQDGLISASVLGMLEDDDGSLWILTRRGLSRMDPDGERFVNYTERNGLGVVSFNARAVARDEKRLYFGALGGLVETAAGQPLPSQRLSPLGITRLRRTGDPDSAPTLQAHGARFNYGEPVTLQFAVLDYEEAPHDYAYRPSGSADWISLESQRDLTLFGLSPGSHSFEIRGRDRLGLWTEPLQVDFEVVPPYWMTRWFRALLLALLALLLLGAHRYRTHRLRTQFLRLQKLQGEREEALQETERRRAELDEAYRGLVHLTRQLESVKEEERQHLARELHDELGQSLTAAKIELQVLRQHMGESGHHVQLDQAVNNFDEMISQVRSLSLSLRPPLLQEAGLVAALEHLLSDLADRSGVDIEFVPAADVSDGSGPAPKAAFRVVQEAVINALHHARARHVNVHLDVRGGGISVEVRDDGIGFDPEEARRSASSGEHLGLLGMGERVRAAGGTLEVDAAPGDGCRIRAWIPLC